MSASYTPLDCPMIVADVTFLSPDDGGRQTLPSFKTKPWYRPHIVIQDPAIRSAMVDENGNSNEHYLGVEFVDGPIDPKFGNNNRCKLRLSYHPRVDYSNVAGGETFTVREGGRLVGFGTVLSRSDPMPENAV